MSAMEEFSELIAYLDEMIQPPPAPQFITCRMITGEEMEVEILPRMSYFALYQAITDKLPQDIRPQYIEQMNLLLEGELVPWHYDQRVVPSSEVYHILLDTVSYQIEITPVDTRLRTDNMLDFQCIEYRVDQTDHSWIPNAYKPAVTSWSFYFLHHPLSQSYLSLEDVKYKWHSSSLKRGNRKDRIDVWINDDHPDKYLEEFIEELMTPIEQTISPSLAGKTFLRQLLISHMTEIENIVMEEDEEDDYE